MAHAPLQQRTRAHEFAHTHTHTQAETAATSSKITEGAITGLRGFERARSRFASPRPSCFGFSLRHARVLLSSARLLDDRARLAQLCAAARSRAHGRVAERCAEVGVCQRRTLLRCAKPASMKHVLPSNCLDDCTHDSLDCTRAQSRFWTPTDQSLSTSMPTTAARASSSSRRSRASEAWKASRCSRHGSSRTA